MNQEASYHHGDLRRALLAAARETIRTKGAARLTVRGVARAANVSHAAPYHHFKDKDGLIDAVLEQRMILLADDLARMVGGGQMLAPILDPFHRSAQPGRREGDEEILGVELAAGAEPAASSGSVTVSRWRSPKWMPTRSEWTSASQGRRKKGRPGP